MHSVAAPLPLAMRVRRHRALLLLGTAKARHCWLGAFPATHVSRVSGREPPWPGLLPQVPAIVLFGLGQCKMIWKF